MLEYANYSKLAFREQKLTFLTKLPFKNICAKSVRSASLLIFSILLAVATFGGSLLIKSLRNGLSSLEKRMGADIIVVPYATRTKESIESLLLNGNRTTFYMNKNYIERMNEIEGIEKVSPQLFLSSISAGCCSVSLQIIGFEPETDFTIQPWASESYKGKLGDFEILVGSKITLPESGTLKFYGVPCKVVAQLKETGSGLDNAIYTNFTTIKEMIKNASKLPNSPASKVDADNVISSLMIKVENGYDVEQVKGQINLKNHKVRAIRAKSMTTGVADSLSSISEIVGILIVVIWILCIVIMLIVFSMIINERKKEFAILRVAGLSQKKLSRLVISESLILSISGGIIGILLVLLLSIPFNTLIQEKLSMPYLIPGLFTTFMLCIGTLLISVISGALASVFSAIKIAKQDTGLILRETN